MVHAPVKGRVMPLEAIGMGMDVGLQRLGRSPVPLLHPKEGDKREIEAVHIGLEALEQLRTLFPIPALDRVDVLRGRVVEVCGQLPPGSLRLDFRENLRLLLGAVCMMGLLVLKPQLRELMTVRHGGKI